MLEKCASGYDIRLATHSRVITFNGKVYRSMPKFKEIELGHIRKMVRFLGIDPKCASKFISI